ncbi:MAG: helix-turn-helix domain-containing protein [Thermoanaerobaculia bacterium]
MGADTVPPRLPAVLAECLPSVSDWTWDDLKPLALALLRSPDHDVLVNHLDDLADRRDTCLRVAATIDRLAGTPDEEPMGDGDLFYALCDELKLDIFSQRVPGVPDDMVIEEIPWTAGLYRALIAELGCAEVLATVQRRAAWRARFYEAGAAIRAEIPPPLAGALESTPGEPTLTLAEASVAIRCHPKTTERYLRSGELRAGRVGRRWRIPRSSIDAFLRSGATKEH